MTAQPEALRLADRLDLWGDQNDLLEAAAELRRQHDEIETLREAYRLWMSVPQIQELKAERDALQATLDDYMDDHKAVVNEQCAGDEIHCSCVPHLRKRIKEVEAERDALLAAAELMTAAIDAARSET